MKINDSAELFSALADKTRLRLLNLLLEGELCVCDLMRVLKEPQSKISRHLGYLRRAGLVEARRQGFWMYYRLSKPTHKIHQGMLEALRKGRSECNSFKHDIDGYRKNKNCLVACCK